jgi:hypothetical protein
VRELIIKVIGLALDRIDFVFHILRRQTIPNVHRNRVGRCATRLPESVRNDDANEQDNDEVE